MTFKTAEWVCGFYGLDMMVDGFTCAHCNTDNKFEGEAADLRECLGGSFNDKLLTCEHCDAEQLMPKVGD